MSNRAKCLLAQRGAAKVCEVGKFLLDTDNYLKIANR